MAGARSVHGARSAGTPVPHRRMLDPAGSWWGGGWVEVSLVLFTLAGVGAIGVLDPASKRLLAAAEAAPDGPVPAALDRQRHDRRTSTVEAMMLATDVAILFLMITKPALAGSLLAVVVVWVLGGGLAVREARHDARPDQPTPASPAPA